MIEPLVLIYCVVACAVFWFGAEVASSGSRPAAIVATLAPLWPLMLLAFILWTIYRVARQAVTGKRWDAL